MGTGRQVVVARGLDVSAEGGGHYYRCGADRVEYFYPRVARGVSPSVRASPVRVVRGFGRVTRGGTRRAPVFKVVCIFLIFLLIS